MQPDPWHDIHIYVYLLNEILNILYCEGYFDMYHKIWKIKYNFVFFYLHIKKSLIWIYRGKKNDLDFSRVFIYFWKLSHPALFILRVSTYVRIRSRLFYEDFYYDLVEMEWILILKLRLLTEMVLIEHLILRFWRHGIQQNWFYWPIFLSN